MTRPRSIACVAVAFALAGCATNGVSAPYPVGTGLRSYDGLGRVAGDKGGATVYVWNQPGQASGDVITVYSSAGASYVRTIAAPSGGFEFDGMAADEFGHLFLGYFLPAYKSNGPGYLTVYSARGSRVVQKLYQGHHFRLPIVDRSDNLFTMCAAARICEYAGAGDRRIVKQQVIRRIALGRIEPYDGVHDFSLDHSGDLAANRGGVIDVFAPGQQTPYWEEAPQGLDGYNGTAFDSSGDLYIAARCVTDWAGEIYEYAPNQKYPVRTIGQNDGISCPYGLAVDRSDNLYVLQGLKTNVTVYPPSNNIPLRVVTEGLVQKQTHLMVLDSLGDMYVSNGGVIGSDPGSVVVFAPGSSVPVRTITANVENPAGLAVGP